MVGLRNRHGRFGAAAMGLHWTMAGLVVPLWALGYYMVGQTGDLLAQYELYQLHKSFGFVVFGLGVLRLAWRLIDPPPPLPATMSRWHRTSARLSHAGFYLLLLGLPVTGFLMSAASPLGIPTVLFETIRIPHPIGPSQPLYDFFRITHYALAWTLAGLVGLHLLAALHHQFIGKDRIMLRMLPFGR